MFGTFLATWIKLRRPALLWGTYGAVAAVATLITSLVFVNATDTASAAGRGGGPPGTGITVASLSQAGGLLEGLSNSVTLLGIIALCVAAAQIAGEYSLGTLRNLLIRRPQRLELLGGAWAGVVTFMIGAVLVAAAFAVATALILSPGQGITTSAWFTADGWSATLRTLGEVALAIGGYATFGAVLGLIMRAPVAAVAVGIGWLLALENVIAGVISGSSRWLPGELLRAVASGGTADVALSTALVTAGAYLVLVMASAAVVFQRRDVTA